MRDAHVRRVLYGSLSCGSQGLTAEKKDPFVRLRLRDTPYSRAMWDHAFELDYEIVLGARQLSLTLVARNPGPKEFAFTAALHSYLGVADVRDDAVMVLVRGYAPAMPRCTLRHGTCCPLSKPSNA